MQCYSWGKTAATNFNPDLSHWLAAKQMGHLLHYYACQCCVFSYWLWEGARAAENARDRGNRSPLTHRQLFIRRLAASLFCLNASEAGRLVRVDAAISRWRRHRGVSEVSLRLSPPGLRVVMFWMTRCVSDLPPCQHWKTMQRIRTLWASFTGHLYNLSPNFIWTDKELSNIFSILF